MNLDYIHLMPEGFDPNSKVWIYQCNRMFGMIEAIKIEETLENFVADWKSHGAPVKGFATIFFGRFIMLMADETVATIGGCSMDNISRLIKSIEQDYKVSLLDRQTLAFVIKDKVELLPLQQLQYGIDNNFINGDTLYFNNLVANCQQFKTNWIQPVKDSWLAKRYNISTGVNV